MRWIFIQVISIIHLNIISSWVIQWIQMIYASFTLRCVLLMLLYINLTYMLKASFSANMNVTWQIKRKQTKKSNNNKRVCIMIFNIITFISLRDTKINLPKLTVMLKQVHLTAQTIDIPSNQHNPRLAAVVLLSYKTRNMLSPEWRCSWSSADRQCSNYICMINNCIAY